MDRSGVMDAGLCHGAAGVAHQLNGLYQRTGDSELLHAAQRWYRHALEQFVPQTGVGGFSAWRGGRWMDDAGLLEGSASVALALLSATTDIEPRWDGLLLL